VISLLTIISASSTTSSFLSTTPAEAEVMQPENCCTILVSSAGIGASLSNGSGDLYARHLLNPVALINREDT